MQRRILLSLLFLIVSFSAFSQVIKGVVTDVNHQPLQNVNIYQPGSNNGTISNVDGAFSLALKKDNNQIFIQCVGFKAQELKLDFKHLQHDLNLVMEEEVIVLPEFKVLGTGEDPAYYVMRKVIAMAPYYSNQLSKYDCKVYIKGTYTLEKVPWLFRSTVEEDGVKIGRAYVTESINKVHFELPNKITQQVVAIRSSEGDEQTSPMGMVINNLYNSDEYGVASPLGPKAFSSYKFKLIGTFKERGLVINKIRVIPRNNGKGFFNGSLYIFENLWSLHSADLKMKLPMMKVKMKQMYGFVEDGVWMPKNFNFKIDGGAMGFKGNATYTASISEYNVTSNPNIDHTLLARINGDVKTINKSLAANVAVKKPMNNKPASKTQKKINKLMEKDELTNSDMRRLNRLIKKETKRSEPIKPLEIKDNIKMAKVCIKNDSTFWASSRPIKLTKDEMVSFVSKDSIQKVIHTPEYKDSIRDSQRKFKFGDIISGRTYEYKKDSSRYSSKFTTPGLLEFANLSFNTVEGFNMDFPFRYSLRDTMGKSFSFSTKFNYAEAREALTFKSHLFYEFDGIKRSSVFMGGGIFTDDYKGDDKESRMENMMYTLWAQKNFMKFYEKREAYVGYSTEIVNGLSVTANLYYARRLPLSNNSSYKFIDVKDRDYTLNVPVNDNIADWQYGESENHSFGVRLEYTPRQYYRIRNNRKQYLHRESPTFTLSYDKAVTVFGGDADYDYLKFGVNQSVGLGFSNTLDYDVRAGKFLSSDRLYAQDMKFFRSFDESISLSSDITKFRSLGYYQAVSSDYFVEGHVKYSMSKFLLKRLPLIGNAMMLQESLFVNYLHTESLNHYFEVGYGLNNIFLLLDTEIVAGFKEGEMDYLGLKFNIKLK